MPIVSTMNVHNRRGMILVEVVWGHQQSFHYWKSCNERSSEDHIQSSPVIMPSQYFFMAASWAIFSQSTSSSTKILYLCSCWNLHQHHQSSCWTKKHSIPVPCQLKFDSKRNNDVYKLPSCPRQNFTHTFGWVRSSAAIQQLYLSLGFGCSSSY